MAARLVVEEGDLKGLVLSLKDQEEWYIGRDPDQCQLVIEDPLVSRRHLICRQTPQGIVVENLSHTNPARLNEEELGSHPRLLTNGDTLKIGSEILRYYTDTSAHVFEEANAQEEPPLPSFIEEEEATFSGEEVPPIAEINFGLVETGRWLLKVISGPNNGAEFYMQADHSYVLGTDPHSCDIVFHDTSVSRQHARITVTGDDQLMIEDLKSRNGIHISGKQVQGKEQLVPSLIVTIGTTSFVVYDREGEMQTIISPLLPSIVRVLQHEEEPAPKPAVETAAPASEEAPKAPEEPLAPPPPPPPPPAPHRTGHMIILSIIAGLFVLGGVAVLTLFKSQPVAVQAQGNALEEIKKAIEPFPALRFSFNSSNGSLLLLGHVATPAEKSQLMYNLQSIKAIKSVDDSGIIIDEGVWQEINSVLVKNPAWKGITIHSPAAGQFVLSGYLKTRKQAEQLSDYISANFAYLDLLKKQIIVEEDVINQINTWLQDVGLIAVTVKMDNGEIVFQGNISPDKQQDMQDVINKTKGIPGVRIVNNFVKVQSQEVGTVNITDQYEVTGQSHYGDKYSVVIRGRNLYVGDTIDGMTITSIKPNVVYLEKDGTRFRIDYNK